jgi:hypothetical protein
MGISELGGTNLDRIARKTRRRDADIYEMHERNEV